MVRFDINGGGGGGGRLSADIAAELKYLAEVGDLYRFGKILNAYMRR